MSLTHLEPGVLIAGVGSLLAMIILATAQIPHIPTISSQNEKYRDATTSPHAQPQTGATHQSRTEATAAAWHSKSQAVTTHPEEGVTDHSHPEVEDAQHHQPQATSTRSEAAVADHPHEEADAQHSHPQATATQHEAVKGGVMTSFPSEAEVIYSIRKSLDRRIDPNKERPIRIILNAFVKKYDP
ncbi:MAG: hypothetical protein EBZ48_17955, partial [Proteobacteria bacterium]|nr:hypothetical protein [Pseudomonadota bacterium]